MTLYGLPNNEIHDDGGREDIKEKILSKNPGAEILDRLPKDNESYVFGEGFLFQYIPCRESRCDEVDRLRDTKQYEGFIYGGKTWDIRPLDIMNILGRQAYAHNGLTDDTNYPWTTEKKTWWDRENIDHVFITRQDFIDFALAVDVFISLLFRKGMDHKRALRLLTNYELIRDYGITTGWE
jgi:hypothetical protein